MGTVSTQQNNKAVSLQINNGANRISEVLADMVKLI
jgi:hypothetical protein